MAFEEFNFSSFKKIIKFIGKSWIASCEQILDNQEILDELANQRFDVALIHFFDACPLFIAHLAKIDKTVWLSPGNFILDFVAQAMRIPNLPSYIPNGMLGLSDRMSFMERLKNFGLLSSFALMAYLPWDNFMLEEMYNFRAPPNEDRPDIFELLANVSSLFINGDRFIDFPRPLPIGANYLGEMAGKSSTTRAENWENLQEPWNSICQTDNKGIILFSLGTIANTTNMPDYMSEAFFDAFKHFSDYSIVWRIEKKIPFVEQYKHIHLTSWIPQRKLLAHPKTRLFITHGGYNSLLETTKAGVPIIMMPLFADQFPNSKRAARRGLGVTLDKTTVTSQDIQRAMTSVLNDSQFAKNGKKLADAINDKLITSDEMLSHRLKVFAKAKWSPTLISAQRLNLIQYMCIDVIVFIMMLMIVVFLIFVKIIHLLFLEMIKNERKSE